MWVWLGFFFFGGGGEVGGGYIGLGFFLKHKN